MKKLRHKKFQWLILGHIESGTVGILTKGSLVLESMILITTIYSNANNLKLYEVGSKSSWTLWIWFHIILKNMNSALQFADTSLWLHIMTPNNFNPVLQKTLLWWKNKKTERKINMYFLLLKQGKSHTNSKLESPWEIISFLRSNLQILKQTQRALGTTHWISWPITEFLDLLRHLK